METFLDCSLRLGAALLLGGIVGMEREYRSKDAGFRTHFLVALGSALFCVVSQYGFGVELKDSSRVAAQVVSGVGFLGAGTIIFQRNVIRGLTTAAGLWVTAAIGLACGSGMYGVAFFTTGLVLFGLEILSALLPKIGTTTVQLSFTATSKESVKRVVNQLRKDCQELYSYELKDRRTSKGEFFEARIEMKIRKGNRSERLIDYLDEFDDVTISSTE
ncbi:MAG: MgtC/SapB family protein [Bacteroidales bacterium]|nr:MgtC/SapB family protein [Bacteroidales bacterium]